MTYDLLRAADRNDEPTVRDLIRKAVNVDYIEFTGDYAGETAVTLAAFQGHVEILCLLLDAGARHRDFVRSGVDNPLIIKEWLARGGDVNWSDEGKWTLLIHAADLSVDTVRMLVEAGADVNAISEEGITALSRANDCRNHEVVKYLWPLCTKEVREFSGLPDNPQQ